MSIVELKAEQLQRACNPEDFDFETTAELQNVTRIIGQPRGTRAIEFGIDIDSPGYNIYVRGEAGTGRTTAIERFLQRRAAAEAVPPDWAYVYNFAEPHKPRALRLPAGTAARLAQEMDRFVTQVRSAIPQAFERDEYRAASDEIEHRLDERREALLAGIREQAEARGFRILRTVEGLVLAPVADGQPMALESLEALPEERRDALKKTWHELNRALEVVLEQMRILGREAQEQLASLQRTVAAGAVGHLVDDLKTRYSGQENVIAFLEDVRQDVIENVNLFKPDQENGAGPSTGAPDGQSIFRRYSLNVLVDHSDTRGAPVVVELYPTFYRLVGRVEHANPAGGPARPLRPGGTDFSLIRCGALLQANGGYLVLRARDVWERDLVWDGLKRALLEGRVQPQDLSARGPVVVSNTLEPEPIPLHVKVVLIGPTGLYFHLFNHDDDFRDLFKVRADFDIQMARTPENERRYAIFVAARCHQEGLRHFDRGAVAQVVAFGSRQAGSQRRLSTRFGAIADLVREASYWAGTAGRDRVTAGDVEKAWRERVYRSNLVEERERERIEEGAVFIDTDGAVVGQVNGLTVSRVADYVYGQPSRIAARTYAGSGGVVQVDREVNLAGPIHNKGVLTLVGYLGGQYASGKAFSFTAQLTFEQSYSDVEGDSASCGELCAILSSLSGLPLKQNVAITGTLNQRGEVQPIGAATEKIEGFFDVCARRGLTGEQGVIIPAANREDLNLRPDVVEAVSEGKFHVWTVTTVDDGLELLTGEAAREVHNKVRARLKELDGASRPPSPRRRDGGLRERVVRWLKRLRKRIPGRG